MYIIGVVLNEEKIKAALFDSEYRQIAFREDLSKNGVNTAAELCRALLADSKISANDVEYIGVAVSENSGCQSCISTELEKKIGIKTVAENIINAEALGEAYLSNVDSAVLVKINNTVESGVVLDKKIYKGSNGMGGKVAHMVINHGGFACSCGRSGCFEAYAGREGVARIARDAGVEKPEALTLTKLFKMNDSAAEKAKKIYTERLANAVVNIINLFQTHELILDGEISEITEPLMKPLTEIILRDQYTKLSSTKCKVRIANKNADTALIGAALILR